MLETENGGSGSGACAPLAMLRSGRKPSATASATVRCTWRLLNVSLREYSNALSLCDGLAACGALLQ